MTYVLSSRLPVLRDGKVPLSSKRSEAGVMPLTWIWTRRGGWKDNFRDIQYGREGHIMTLKNFSNLPELLQNMSRTIFWSIYHIKEGHPNKIVLFLWRLFFALFCPNENFKNSKKKTSSFFHLTGFLGRWGRRPCLKSRHVGSSRRASVDWKLPPSGPEHEVLCSSTDIFITTIGK